MLAAGGHRVRLFQAGDTPSGLTHPRLVVGTGRMRVAPPDRALTEEVLGALVEAPEADRAVLARGRMHRLPLSPAQVPALFDRRVAAHAASEWTRARARNAMHRFVGGGQEERTYADWVERRMGGVAAHHLYRPYARRRWGLDPKELSVSVARLFHGVADSGPHQVMGGGPQEALAHAEQVLRAAGGEIRTGVRVRALRVDGERVGTVILDDGEEIPVEGPLWVAEPYRRVVGWLRDAASTSLRFDAERQLTATLVEVALTGDTTRLHSEIHVLDAEAPFWRVVCPYGMEQTAIFHATALDGSTLGDDATLAEQFAQAARQLGLGHFSTEGSRVERLADWQPVWTPLCHVRSARLLRAFRRLGIVAVGRKGTFSFIDPGQEIALAARYRDEDDPDQKEAHRVMIDPPIRIDDLDARITRFVER